MLQRLADQPSLTIGDRVEGLDGVGGLRRPVVGL